MDVTLERRVKDLIQALTVNEELEGSIEALAESVIIKEVFDVPVSTLLLAGIDVNKKGKNNDLGSALETIRNNSTNNKTTIVSVGFGTDKILGGKVSPGDEVILDLNSSGYGVMYMLLKDNSRCPIRVGTLLGGEYMTKTLIEAAIEYDKEGAIFKNKSIQLHLYMKITPLHLVCKRK